MRSIGFIARGVALSALLATATPALAQGKADRARIAVAEARAKVEAADKLTGDGELVRVQAEARAVLRTAEEDLAGMHKDKAIATANEASRLADTAIGLSQRNRAQAEAAGRADARAADMNAAAAATARQDAAIANDRAAAAEQNAAAAQAAAAAAAADAAAARATPPPAPVTTVTTETVRQTAAPARARVTKKVVKRRAPVRRVATRTVVRPAVTEKTTTTITTRNR